MLFTYHREDYNAKFELDLALVYILSDTPTTHSFSSSAKSATALEKCFEAIANENV